MRKATDAVSGAGTQDAQESADPAIKDSRHRDSLRRRTLSLIDLSQEQIDAVVEAVQGRASNIIDIYPLAPLQEGMLFHHLLSEQGDTFILSTLFEISSEAKLTEFIAAVQTVIDRHEVLRSAVVWEKLPRPVQVVCRDAELDVERVAAERGQNVLEVLRRRMTPGAIRIDLSRSPLVRLSVAANENEQRRFALLQVHHIACDLLSWNRMNQEILSICDGRAAELRAPDPYRNYVAWALPKAAEADAESFFRAKLEGIDEPTAPFGLLDVHGDGTRIDEVRQALEPELVRDIRTQARKLGVSVARLFHATWALVVALASGRDDVVFGTVLLAAFHKHTHERPMLGMTVNTLPLRLRLRGLTIKEFIEHTHNELSDLLTHQQAPLSLAQRCSDIPSSGLLFTSVLNCRRGSAEAADRATKQQDVKLLERHGVWTNYPFTMSVDDHGEEISVTAQIDRRIGAERVFGYLKTALRSVVDALDESPDTAALDLAVLTDAERRQVIEGFNAAAARYEYASVDRLIERWAAVTPDAVAITCGNRNLTYRELNDRANHVACALARRGVALEDRVCVFIERSLDMVVGLLGILKVGAAYVPLDPDYPPERLRHILKDSSPAVVLTQESLADSLRSLQPGTTLVDIHECQEKERWNDGRSGNIRGAGPRNLTYVIYTSGSTGVPKGVMIEHGNLVNLVRWHCEAFDVTQKSRCSCVASIGFDAATWEIWPPLAAGGTVVLAPAELTRDVERLLGWWQSQPLDVSFLPTPVAELALQRGSSHETLRTLLVGGDRLRSAPLDDSYALVNNYGPTEATVLVTSGRVTKEDRILHIGSPISNARAYILNERHQPVPIGVVGEIYIGGAGVGRGYLGRPELTAERFLPDPFGSDPGSLLYKTGDLGRWLEDGRIEFLGRNDDQVKVRGFRIELREIETQLAGHDRVKEAIVVIREDDGSDKRLIAYVVPQEPLVGAESLVHQLRSHLRSALPDYMMPSAFVLLARVPLTNNGKVDRRALPAPDAASYEIRDYEPPRGEVEEILAGIWGSILRVARVGRYDSFFELGGHSLTIVQMIAQLRNVGLLTDIRQVFKNPRLAELAAVLTGGAESAAPLPANLIPPGSDKISPEMLTLVDLSERQIELILEQVPGGAPNVADIYPLAPLQEGILFHHLLSESGGDVYVLPLLLELSSRSRVDDLIEALQQVVDRHDVLRTAVLWQDLPRPVQVVYREARLPVEEVTLRDDEDPFEQMNRWMQPEWQRMVLSRGPLVRVKLAQGRAGRWYALIQLHHIVGDGQSLKALIAELVAVLEKRSLPSPPPEKFRDHVARGLRYVNANDTEAFFRGRLGDIDEPTAPFGLMQIQGDATRIEEAAGELESELAQSLRRLARSVGVSPATVFHAAWALVVASTSGRDDVVFGTVLHGRYIQHAEQPDTLGMFINTLPLRLRLQAVTAKELVTNVHQELALLLVHDQASLVAAQRCSGITGSAPLFSALLNYRHSARMSYEELSRANGVRVLAVRRFTNYPVSLSVDDRGEGFLLTAQTDRSVAARRVIDYMRMAIRSLLEAIEQAPITPALDLTVIPKQEFQQVVNEFNATRTAHSHAKLVHELFEDQASAAPTVTAVTHGHESLTYEQLNRRAERVAQVLRSRGVGPDVVVALCASRSVSMVAGVLGVLKAGAAYLPLDPMYPVERLRAMVEDARPKVVLVEPALRSVIPECESEVIELGGEAVADQVANTGEAFAKPGPSNLVYVIYTSGSTGRPKGTAMPHRSMVNLMDWHRRCLPLRRGQRVLQFAALSFDVAFQEMFSTLGMGGTLVLVDESVRRDAHALLQLLKKDAVQRLFAPPLLLQSLAEHALETGVVLADLKEIITAGEQLHVTREIVGLVCNTRNCQLHNHYGPTETHVVSALSLSGDPEKWPALPSIGQPISNSRMYILDKHLRPVPIHVTGEVYIGGVNNARGYLNRPQLTAERFVADPFGPEAGMTMYRTGDLARWHEDGRIEYLGRNDDQVKVRGFRIELGEIESRLARHPRVREAAVVARQDKLGQKRLVAFMVPQGLQSPNTEELLEFLKGALPNHMIPSSYVCLERLPITPNGKLDRRALQRLEVASSGHEEHEPARGEDEQVIATIFGEVLGVQRIGRNDSFFDLGGHSLLVLKAVVRMSWHFGSSVKVLDLYNHPTPRELAVFIRGRTDAHELVNLSTEAQLDGDIVVKQRRHSAEQKSILLTGATGFVGRFLLVRLLQDTESTAYCLIRAASPESAWLRLKGTLKKWSLWRDEYEHRIVAVPGDLRLPRLGMNESVYLTLTESVDSIYHCGTSMNHLESYAMARPANVESVREVIRFASLRKPKLVNHISTLGIFGPTPAGAARVIDETSSIDDEKHPTSSGYAASKWVAEKIVMNARERGVACNIFRLGLAWADSERGRYDEQQREYRVFKSCLLSGSGIKDYRPDPFVPVDYVARAVSYLAGRQPFGDGTFHISSPSSAKRGLFERYNEIGGPALKLVPIYEWIRELRRLHMAGYSLPAVPLFEFAFSLDEEAFHAYRRRVRLDGTRIECSKTYAQLGAAGVRMPELNDELLRRFVEAVFERDEDLKVRSLPERMLSRRSAAARP